MLGLELIMRVRASELRALKHTIDVVMINLLEFAFGILKHS